MRRDIIISSFRKIPKGLLFIAILVLLTEWFIYSNRAGLIDDWWNKFLINEHELINMQGDYDYLIMGDSVQKTGIDPTLVSDNLLNLGLPGAKPMGQFLMLKRYLEKHKPPKAIFLYVDPEDPRDSLFVILRYFVSIPEFVSIWRDLSWQERRIFIWRYWATLDMRKVELAERDKYPHDNNTFVKTMKQNRGYVSSPRAGEAISDDYFSKTKDRHQEEITISERDLKYLDKFIELASSKNIKIVFLGFLVPEELLYTLEKTGFNKDYLSFFNRLKKKYPEAYFVKDPIYYLENRYFGDTSHLNNKGSGIHTEFFKNQIFIPHTAAIKSD